MMDQKIRHKRRILKRQNSYRLNFFSHAVELADRLSELLLEDGSDDLEELIEGELAVTVVINSLDNLVQLFIGDSWGTELSTGIVKELFDLFSLEETRLPM